MFKWAGELAVVYLIYDCYRVPQAVVTDRLLECLAAATNQKEFEVRQAVAPAPGAGSAGEQAGLPWVCKPSDEADAFAAPLRSSGGFEAVGINGHGHDVDMTRP